MSKALELLSLENCYDEVPVGCIIVKNNLIIASSTNSTLKKKNVMTHAEINAIKKISNTQKDWRLDTCDLFVTMEPCLMCMGAIILSRIRSVYYGISNTISGAFHGEVPIQDSKLKTLIISGIMEQEIKNKIQDFFRKQRLKKDESYKKR